LIGGLFDPDTDPDPDADADKAGMVFFTVSSRLIKGCFLIFTIPFYTVLLAHHPGPLSG
jgi:hypothetical protein